MRVVAYNLELDDEGEFQEQCVVGDGWWMVGRSRMSCV